MCFLEGFMAGVIAFGCVLRLAEIVTKLISGELVAIPKIEESWLPINTAPKDGTTVELKNVHNGLRDVGYWCDYSHVTGVPSGEWSQKLGNGGMTHWRPRLPEMLKEQA